MKILLVDLEYDYGIPERGPNLIRKHGYEFGLKKNGHEIVHFFYDRYFDNLDVLQEQVLKIAEGVKPDLIFFILFRDHFSTQTLDKLKINYKTMNWFGDDTWRFDSFSKKYAPHFTYVITTDKFSVDKYKKNGCEKVVLSQWAALEDVEKSFESSSYQYDVSFIGGINKYRKWFVEQLNICLKDENIVVNCFGNGWPRGPVSNREMHQIMRQSKINLNISNSASPDIRFLKNPINLAYYLKTQKHSEQIKARNFEIPFFGGFQLTNYHAGLEDYFAIGSELACYSNIEEAALMIKYYLKNENKREDIRQKGESRASTQHGYSHRFQEIFKELGL